MESPDDRELTRLLREWKAPDAPPTLRPPRLPRREPWWRWFVTGTIRVPVPVGIAVIAFVAVWMYWSSVPSRVDVGMPAPASVTLADFQPVENVNVRVVGGVR